jgi:hypothetical protein
MVLYGPLSTDVAARRGACPVRQTSPAAESGCYGKPNHRIELDVDKGIAMISATPGAVNRPTTLRYDVAVTERDTIVETKAWSISSQWVPTFSWPKR